MKKAIIIDSCVICPFVGKCDSWKKLTKKQRVSLMIGHGTPKIYILNGCPLPNIETEEEVFTGVDF